MKKVFIIPILLLFSNTIITAQTKIISYKSHSGNMEHFENSVLKNLYNTNFSNLGVGPERYVINSKLDSVIIIDEHKSVIVTSKYCKNRIARKSEKWKPGRDTVYNHPVFSNENVNEAKKILKNEYNFQNDIDSTVFLKYDAKKKKYKPISTNKKMIKKAEIKSSESIEGIIYILVVSVALYVSVSLYKKHC